MTVATFRRFTFLISLLWALHMTAAGNLNGDDGDFLYKRTDLPAEYSTLGYYPTPVGGWVDEWADAYEKAQKIVSNMTLAEKVNLTSGTGYLMGPCVGNTGSALRFDLYNFYF